MTPFQIKHANKVTHFDIGAAGISIIYLLFGQRKNIALAPEEAVIALCEACVIKDWKVSDDDAIKLLVDYGGSDEQIWLSWDEYVEQVGMFQYAAVLITINHELKLQNYEEEKALAEKSLSNYFQRSRNNHL
jgi:hypothetical protein